MPLPFALLLAAAASAAPMRVAVYDFDTVGLDRRVTAVVGEALVAELRKYEGISILGMSEVRALLGHESSRQMVGCEADTACLTEIAGALGVDAIVTGQCARVGNTSMLTAKRISVQLAKVEQSASRRVPFAGGEELVAAVGEVGAELMRDHDLMQGERRGAQTIMVQLLNPPPLRPWTFVATAGAAVAGAGTALGFVIAASSAKSDWDRLVRTGRTAPVDGGELLATEQRVRSRALTGQILFGVASAFVVGAVVEALFTDWHGYRDWKPGMPFAPPE